VRADAKKIYGTSPIPGNDLFSTYGLCY